MSDLRPRLLLATAALLAALLMAACDGDSQGASPTAAGGSAGPAATSNSGNSGNSGEAVAGPGQVAWEQCPFTMPGVDLQCGALAVPAHRDEPASGTVTLRFAVVRAPERRAEDPIVYLSGGPGQAAMELLPTAWSRLYEPLADGRDLVILDQRGVGYSEPSLFCHEYSDWAREALATGDTVTEEGPDMGEVIEACRQRLEGQGVDFSNFTSAATAADVDALREALGYDQWNLYGNSYGSRVALTVMRDFPDGVRSAVLDAAYPVDANLYQEAPHNVARAFQAFFATCAEDSACAQAFPDLEQTFAGLVERLNAEPASIPVPDPTTGQRHAIELSGDALVGFLFQSLYVTDLVQFLPEIIDAADRGDFGVIGLLQGTFATQVDLTSLGMQLAVQCHEEVPFTDQQAIAQAAAAHPLLRGFFDQSQPLGAGLPALCEDWRSAEPPAVEDEPVESDIPTLVMTGSLDPITPPHWGEAVAERLPNAHFVEFPYTGHGVVGAHDCGAALVRTFLDAPRAAPDAACVQEVSAPDFTAASVEVELVPFTTPNGPHGLRPRDWIEVLPGVYQQSPLVTLAHQVLPGATEQQLLAQVAALLGGGEAPEPAGEVTTDVLTWRLYEMTDLGLAVDLAIAEHEGALMLVQLTSAPMRRDAYHQAVFRPVVEAFTPPADPVPPFPGGSPVPPTGGQ
ncbi:MAG: alpha/beta hydrolase [Dehalococcoidia bacterium]|nr:alpha/beta hydrolase [Dehalococcoidia bacterium]